MRAYCCEICDSPDPNWRIMRVGDAVTSWACDEDVYTVLHRMQRDWEITELVVTNAVKQREWATIEGSLSRIADEG